MTDLKEEKKKSKPKSTKKKSFANIFVKSLVKKGIYVKGFK